MGTTHEEFILLGHVYGIPYPTNMDMIDRFKDKVCDMEGVESIGDAMGARPFMIVEIDVDGISENVLERIYKLYQQKQFGGMWLPE